MKKLLTIAICAIIATAFTGCHHHHHHHGHKDPVIIRQPPRVQPKFQRPPNAPSPKHGLPKPGPGRP